MYQKYLVVASKKDTAGMNIANNLLQFRQNPILSSMGNSSSFDIYLVDESILHNENLDMGKISRYDFVIFASQHKSEKGEKSLSVHPTGNWGVAEYGGEDGKASRVSALFMKHIFETMHSVANKYELDKKYKLTLEVTHHGPLINKPSLFIEIGPQEEEWSDRRAGFIVAKTISEAVETFKSNKYREIAVGIGGPHYCPNFNKLQLSSNVAFSHIIPSYASPITEEMIKEAISKTEEELDFAVIDWKSFNAEDRQKIIDILQKNYISYKKVSEIDR